MMIRRRTRIGCRATYQASAARKTDSLDLRLRRSVVGGDDGALLTLCGNSERVPRRTGVEGVDRYYFILRSLMRFLFLIFLGPTHEVAIYSAAGLAQPSFNALVASGFKYTALGAYHALLVKLPGEAEQDEWDYLGTAVTALASAVYTVEWFGVAADQTMAGPSVAVGCTRRRPNLPKKTRKPRRVRSSDRSSRPGGRRVAPRPLVDRGASGPSCGCDGAFAA